jgi:hypothetical protein
VSEPRGEPGRPWLEARVDFATAGGSRAARPVFIRRNKFVSFGGFARSGFDSYQTTHGRLHLGSCEIHPPAAPCRGACGSGRLTSCDLKIWGASHLPHFPRMKKVTFAIMPRIRRRSHGEFPAGVARASRARLASERRLTRWQ